MSSAINTRGSRHSFTTIATLRGASPNSTENTGQSSGAPGLRQPEQGNQQAGGHQQQTTGYQAAGRSNHRPPPRGWRRTSQISTGAPRKALTTDTRSSPGTSRRPITSANSSRAGGEQGDRQRPAMIGPHQPARHMRHHQADKGDGADDGGGAAAQDGDDDQADQLGAGDAAAEGGGGIVARARCSAPGSAAERRSPTTTGSRTIFSVCRVRISSEPACQKRS